MIPEGTNSGAACRIPKWASQENENLKQAAKGIKGTSRSFPDRAIRQAALGTAAAKCQGRQENTATNVLVWNDKSRPGK